MLDDQRSEIVAVESPVWDRGAVPRWGGIAAGSFTVLALLALLAEIGVALGLSSYSSGDRAMPYLLGAGIWGALSAILAVLGGGYVASRVGRHVVGREGAVQGALVWAVAVPVIGVLAAVLAIGAVTAAGVTTVAAVQADPIAAADARDAAHAAAPTDARASAGRDPRRVELDSQAPATAKVESASKKAAATGWAAVAAMILSLGAAGAGGLLGARKGVVLERRAVRTLPPQRDDIEPSVRAIP